MFTALFFLSLIFAISTHELGHAILLRRYGVKVREICLLGFGPRLFRWRWRSVFGNTPITVRLLPLGAFVRPLKQHVEKMPADRYIHMCGGGIAMNLLFAGVLSALFLLLEDISAIVPFLFTAGMLICGTVIWKIPRLSGYLVLLLGIFAVGFLIYSLLSEPVDKVIGGPATIISLGADIRSLPQFCLIVSMLSMSLAILNAMPLGPLDGGQIMMRVLKERAPIFHDRFGQLIHFIGFILILVLIATAIGSDIVKFVPFDKLEMLY